MLGAGSGFPVTVHQRDGLPAPEPPFTSPVTRSHHRPLPGLPVPGRPVRPQYGGRNTLLTPRLERQSGLCCPPPSAISPWREGLPCGRTPQLSPTAGAALIHCIQACESHNPSGPRAASGTIGHLRFSRASCLDVQWPSPRGWPCPRVSLQLIPSPGLF